MSWHELSITVPFEYVEPVSYLFERYGYGLSVETRPGDCAVLRSYLPSLSRQRLAHIEVGIRLASSVAELGELQGRQGCLGRQKCLVSQILPSFGEPTNSSSLLQMYVACMGRWERGRLFDAFFRAARKAGMLGESELTLFWGI